MFLSPDDVKKITDSLLNSSRAQSCTVSVTGDDQTNLRFARNNATTNGSIGSVDVSIESNFDGRSGMASVSSLDAGALAKAQARSEEIARLTPVNPEFMPPLGPQTYAAGAGYDAASAEVRATHLASAAKEVISQAEGRNLYANGFAETRRSFMAMANSAGLFAYNRSTGTSLTISARNKTGMWSGWSGGSETRFDRIDAGRLGKRAVDKAAYDATPIDLEPGKYTVILEPSAVASLVSALVQGLEARSADEGRSFLTRKGGGNKLGEKLFDETVTIYSDPDDPIASERIYGEEGLPQKKIMWVERGVVKNLSCSRFWAQKNGREPLPSAFGFVMLGGTASVDDMIKDVKKGVLVTRFWYIRDVDPQTLLLTGLTRDGNFLIENGRIVGPARNLRFNESPAAVLANVIAAGPSERAFPSESSFPSISVPPLLVKDFTFSSKSSGI
jgi:predicted Zn-dependent protease